MTDYETLSEILREALLAGQSVEIDGLGIFHASQGGYKFLPQVHPEVFVAYVAEDLAPARRLCESLRASGCSPWLDKDKLLPGQNWPRAIERAIEVSGIFIACFSPRSVLKRGHFQCELRYALDCARKRPLSEPTDAVYIIPVRLEECTVPRRISDQVQYVDLFPDWDKGIRRLAKAIHRSARARPLLALS
ncbi:MAG: toll/interleukin-1 receptor domain-containing protein [Acidobacteriota bacterium]|nr:toll/interleukin-1 receptor domain-containing protein [Acidobacteriota bacterium]